MTSSFIKSQCSWEEGANRLWLFPVFCTPLNASTVAHACTREHLFWICLIACPLNCLPILKTHANYHSGNEMKPRYETLKNQFLCSLLFPLLPKCREKKMVYHTYMNKEPAGGLDNCNLANCYGKRSAEKLYAWWLKEKLRGKQRRGGQKKIKRGKGGQRHSRGQQFRNEFSIHYAGNAFKFIIANNTGIIGN